MPAVISNIWMEYEEFGQEAIKSELDFIVIQCEQGYIAAKRVQNLVVCGLCNNEYNLGLIKSKLDTLANAFSKQMKPIEKFMKDETYE